MMARVKGSISVLMLVAGFAVASLSAPVAQAQEMPTAAEAPADIENPFKSALQNLSAEPNAAAEENMSADAANPADTSMDAMKGTLPQDLSPWGMFMGADMVVKAVLLGLIFASLLTWTVWLAKSLELAAARRRAQSAMKALTSGASLREALTGLAGHDGPTHQLARAAETEMTLSAEVSATDKDGIKERVVSRLERIEAATGRKMAYGTGLLATIGATAPFVGLFGTVWGIMNSFIGISKSQTTNLAVVAPGIAEALLATAVGLIAAIPAVIIYNVFARAIANYRAQIGDASAEVLRLVSRDLDRQSAAPHRKAAE